MTNQNNLEDFPLNNESLLIEAKDDTSNNFDSIQRKAN
jgi:hypothetical protein